MGIKTNNGEDDRVHKARIWMRKWVATHTKWTPSIKDVIIISDRFKISGPMVLDLYEEVKRQKWGFPRLCR